MARGKNGGSANSNAITETTDVFGRNLSYLLSCVNSPTYQLTSIDLESCEMESGYTPLHVCLKLGYFQKAFLLNEQWKTKTRNNVLIKDEKLEIEKVWNFKDRESLNPLELYRVVNHLYTHDADLSNTIDMYTNKRGAKTLYTFGCNSNMQLGTGDANDRKTLYNIELDEHALFRKVYMKKYHTVVHTMDDDIYVSGSNSKNRMGFKTTSNIKSQPHFKKIILGNKTRTSRIKQLAIGDSHGMVVFENDELLAWGSNEFHQLGYSTSEKDYSDPKAILFQPWKKTGADIKFIAVSDAHSCVLDSDNYLHSWGLNLGQMGTPLSSLGVGSTASSSKNTNVHYKNKKGTVLSTPFSFKLSRSIAGVKQIVTTDFVTLILHGDNELFVISNFKTYKFSIPKLGQLQNSFDKFVPTNLSKPNRVIKIATQNRYGNNLCALYESGAVGIFSIKLETKTSEFWNNQSHILPFKYYWMPYFEWNRCLDFEVGSDGQLILCTIGGDVFFTPSSSRNIFKKNRSNKLVTGKCVGVACDAKFLSFSVLKDDVDGLMNQCVKNQFYVNISQFSPLEQNHSGDWKSVFDFESVCIDHESFFEKPPQVLMSSANISSLSVDNLGYDVEFVDARGNVIGKCHKVLLEARCELLVQSLEKYGFKDITKGESKFVSESDMNAVGTWRIVVEISDNSTLQCETLKYALHYLYSDVLIKSIDESAKLSVKKPNEYVFSVIQFINGLGMNVTQFRDGKLHFSIQKMFSQDGDVSILLNDGKKQVPAHSLILRSGSEFFNNYFKHTWNLRNGIIDLSFFDEFEFEFVLMYMYGFDMEDLLHKHVELKKDETHVINFCLGVLNVCDYLVLDDLKETVEMLLSKRISSTSCLPLLLYSYEMDCQFLFESCCWYVYNNVGLLFQDDFTSFLKQNFNDKLWSALETQIREFQNRKHVTEGENVKFDSWYSSTDTSIKLVKKFKEDLYEYNSVFMDDTNPFQPVFDFKMSQKIRSLSSNSNVYSKNRKPSSSGISQLDDQRRRSSTCVVLRQSTTDTEDIERFRRASSKMVQESVFDDDGPEIIDGQAGQREEHSNIADTHDGFITVVKGSSKTGSFSNKTKSDSSAPHISNANSNNLYKSELRPNNRKNSSCESINSTATCDSGAVPNVNSISFANFFFNRSNNSSFVSLDDTNPEQSNETHSAAIAPAFNGELESKFPSFSEVLKQSGKKATQNTKQKNSTSKEFFPESSNVNKVLLKKITQKDKLQKFDENKLFDQTNTAGDKQAGPWKVSSPVNTPKISNIDFPSLTEVHSVASGKGALPNKNTTSTLNNKTLAQSKNGLNSPNKNQIVQQATPGMVSYFRNIKNSKNKLQQTPIRTKSIDECRKELEFEKWWAEESKKIQNQLKQQKDYEEKLFAVYGGENSKSELDPVPQSPPSHASVPLNNDSTKNSGNPKRKSKPRKPKNGVPPTEDLSTASKNISQKKKPLKSAKNKTVKDN